MYKFVYTLKNSVILGKPIYKKKKLGIRDINPIHFTKSGKEVR